MGARLERIVVVGLASYRLARIVPRDTVADGLRRRLVMWAVAGDGASDSDRNPRQWLVGLLTCPVCSGWWISGALTITSGVSRRAGQSTSAWGRRSPSLGGLTSLNLSSTLIDWWASAAVVTLAAALDREPELFAVDPSHFGAESGMGAIGPP